LNRTLERIRLYQHAAIAGAAALPRAVSLISTTGRPRIVVYFGNPPGDDRLSTPILEPLAASGQSPLWMMTRHPDLLRGNPSVARVLPYDEPLAYSLALIGVRRLRLRFLDFFPDEDRASSPSEHVIHVMARRAGLDPANVPLAPRLYLDAADREFGRFGDRQIAIHSSAVGAGMPIGNKEWYPERFQQVVDTLGGDCTFVQLGLATDPPLRGAVDLRGKTTLRQAAAAIAHSSAFVGLAGFLMHVAKAVGTKSVIVYGGREHPSQTGYVDNVNLFTAMPCAPCWLWNRCDYRRECMDRIQPADVVSAIRSIAAL